MSANRLGPGDTIPDLKKEDFVVHGKRPGTYKYPFRFDPYPPDVYPAPTQIILEPGLKPLKIGETNYFFDAAINPQELLDATHGKVVEVGGPTPDGYPILNTLELPSRPIITNLWGKLGGSSPDKYSNTLTRLDQLTMDALADSRNLAFRDNSIGVLLASGLPVLDTFTREESSILMSRQKEAFRSYINDLTSSKQGDHAQHISDAAQQRMASDIKTSPRIGFWLEAVRTVEPGGIIIYQSGVKEELELAKQLGFKVVGHGERLAVTQHDGTEHIIDIPEEIIFQKT